MKKENARPYIAGFSALFLEALVLLAMAAMVFFYGQQTPLMTGFIGVLIAVRFALLYERGDVIYFLLGVIAGGGNDVMSMWRGVYSYTPPTILPVPIPVWMVVFWGLAFLFLRRLLRYSYFVEDKAPRLLNTPFLLDLVVVVAYRVIVYNYASEPWLPGALFAFILAVRVLLAPPTSRERTLMLLVLILGPFYESLLISGGLYNYQNPAFLGMPLWLIVYWVFIMRFIKAIFDWMEKRLPEAVYY
ncbi:MAG: DUF2878 family protein [bacterium]